MTPERTRLLLIVAAFWGLVSPARASVFSKSDLSLGVTSNSYLTDTATRSDEYWKLGESLIFSGDTHEVGAKVAYASYFKEDPLDFVQWRLDDRITLLKNKGAYLLPEVFGKHYVNGAPVTEESLYSYVGGGLGFEKENRISPTLSLSLVPRYQLRAYTPNNRTDHRFSGAVTLTSERAAATLSGTAELGFIASSDSNYGNIYFDMGGDADFTLGDDWTAGGFLDLESTHFTSRTVSTTTVSTRARGKIVTTRDTEHEVFNWFSIGGRVKKYLAGAWSTNAQLRYSHQGSRSGLDNFSVTEFIWTLTLSL